MVSLNMTRYSLILTTTLLFGVLAMVTGRSVESEKLIPDEEFELNGEVNEGDYDEFEEEGRSYSMSPSTSASIESIFKQIMSLLKGEEGSDQPTLLIVPINSGGGGGFVGGGGGGGAISDGGGSIPTDAIAQAVIPEIVGAAIAEAQSDGTRRRRRRRRRRPSASGGNRIRVSPNRRRRPNNGRRVFVVRDPDSE